MVIIHGDIQNSDQCIHTSSDTFYNGICHMEWITYSALYYLYQPQVQGTATRWEAGLYIPDPHVTP